MNIPTDFRPISMKSNPFLENNGPLYGRWAESRFTLGFRVEERHCNPGHICDGGMLATLADMTLLLGCNLQGGIQGLLQVDDRIVARPNGIFKPTGEPNSHLALATQFGLIE